MKRLCSLLLAALLLLPLLPRPAAAAGGYPDVPDGWALPYITRARECNLLLGNADGTFGYDRTITRAEFVTVLCRMFGWAQETPAAPSFADLGDWYDGYVEAGLAHGAYDGAERFRPRDPITRREMAVMLVRALGLNALAAQTGTDHLPFTDLTGDGGYIALAYDMGMVNGVTPTTFVPEGTAKRQEAAAMLVRVYDRFTAGLDWVHGFYAFSSYSQRALAGQMDAVSYGWSRMTWDGARAALDTADSEWRIPAGYDGITDYLDAQSVPANLSVFMSAGCAGLLASETGRAQAAAAIAAEAVRPYELTGTSPYAGVTVDFEGLRAASRADFVLFLTALRAALPADRLLYCAVQPLTADGDCYDGYDYRAIGALCDRVILMAHDYAPVSMTGLVGAAWQHNAAPAPLDQVWYALRQITDAETGVEDRRKVALALSMGCEGWYVDENDRLTAAGKVTPTPETVALRMSQSDTVPGFQDRSGCAYLRYTADDGRRVFLWYESERSVALKLLAARMLGVTGVSLWRLGTIPTYEGWDVWQTVQDAR